jgi:crossover junction endodeoxyribonuclease RuvC
MTILGVDPGIARTGYALVRDDSGRLTALAYGCVTTSSRKPEAVRLQELKDRFDEILAEFNPQVLASEKLLFNTNVTTAICVGRAQGVVFLAAAKHSIPICEYTPLEIKQAVAGYGRAGKAQVQEMVRRILKLHEIPRPDDAADALAVCIAHAAGRRMREAAGGS